MNKSNSLDHELHLKQGVNNFSYKVFSPLQYCYLLLRRGAKLFGLLGGDGGGHVERLHQLVVAELLIELQLGHEAVGERHDRLDSVLQLAVAEVVQQLAHLERTQTWFEGRNCDPENI